MNFFEIDWTQKATALLKEALLFRKYKAMHLVLAIFCGIFMLPLVLLDVIFAAFLYVVGFVFRLWMTPIKGLHALLADEGARVKHGTQAVVYWVAWPIVFGLYCIAALTLVLLSLLYAVLAALTYLWSFGGIRFHTSPAEDDLSVEVDARYPVILPIVYVAVCAVLLAFLPTVLTLIDCIRYDAWEFFGEAFTLFFMKNAPVEVLFSVLYSAIALSPRPKNGNK